MVIAHDCKHVTITLLIYLFYECDVELVDFFFDLLPIMKSWLRLTNIVTRWPDDFTDFIDLLATKPFKTLYFLQ